MKTSTAVQRTRILARALTTLAVVMTCGGYSAAAQEIDSTKVIIDVGNADGPPGRTLSVPVNIAVPEGVKVGGLELDVTFDKDLLSYTKNELAPQGKADTVKVTTSVEDHPSDPKKSILRVKATSEGTIGSGAIVDLFFRINPKAKPPAGNKEKLPGTSHAVAKFGAPLTKDARVLVGGTLTAAPGRDGRIDITEGVALFGCFFYMH